MFFIVNTKSYMKKIFFDIFNLKKDNIIGFNFLCKLYMIKIFRYILSEI